MDSLHTSPKVACLLFSNPNLANWIRSILNCEDIVNSLHLDTSRPHRNLDVDIEANPQRSLSILSLISEKLSNLKNGTKVNSTDTQRQIEPINFSNSVDLYTRNKRSVALCTMSPLPLKFIHNIRKYSQTSDY